MPPGQAALLADDSLRGAAWCRAHSDVVDAWLASVFEEAVGDAAGVALVAVGGYGRAELAPQSDIDVMLVHDGRGDIKALADRVWYPVWDAGVHLGHSVRTVKEAAGFAADDLDTATALLSARLVAGDPALAEGLAVAGRGLWERKARQWLSALAAGVRERHARLGEVAFLAEPDLKDGRGGLRDVHCLRWAQAAGAPLVDPDDRALAAAYDVLLDARVELQRITGRPANVLAAAEQAAVAAALGCADAPALRRRVSGAARLIAWTGDDTWRRVGSTGRGRGRSRARRLGGGLVLTGLEAGVEAGVVAGAGGVDPVLPLRLARAAAEHGAAIERSSLEALADSAPPMPEPWPPGAREELVALLLAGPAAVAPIEALDQRGLWSRVLPEWEAVRSLPNATPYHRFTVDRHLLETVAHAARLAPGVARPDLLVLGALLHDLGKGRPGDHTVEGMALAMTVGERMRLAPDDTAAVVRLIEHHLLLWDVATRRDLDDPGVIDRVADAMGTVEHLRLQAALAEADAAATGPAAAGQGRADMLRLLVERVEHVLVGGDAATAVGGGFPGAELLARAGHGERHIDAVGDLVTVVADDRPGLFSRVAGVLALHGLDVLTASAYSSEDGRAVNQFRVVDRFRSETPWPRVVADIERALDGVLALTARLSEKARLYARGPVRAGAATSVAFDNEGSADATIVDVHTTDGVGVLYRITRALADFDLDIRSARVSTMGAEAVDAFYVRTRAGGKLTDPGALAELARAIVHSVEEAV